jgi:hypothetical protein
MLWGTPLKKPMTAHAHGPPGPPCPLCGAARTKRLIYGLIDYELLLELGSKEPNFELGWMSEPRLAWHCGQCGHRWGNPTTG